MNQTLAEKKTPYKISLKKKKKKEKKKKKPKKKKKKKKRNRLKPKLNQRLYNLEKLNACLTFLLERERSVGFT